MIVSPAKGSCCQISSVINAFFDEKREKHICDGKGDERRAKGSEHGASGDVIPNVLQANE